MPVVQENYQLKSSSGQPQSVWLVVDVPAIDHNKVEELKKSLTDCADSWIKDVTKNRSFRQPYNVDSGIAEMGK